MPTTIGSSGAAIKALVIEFASGFCDSAPGGEIEVVELSLTPPGGAGPFGHAFVPVVTLSTSSFITYAFSGQTSIYAVAGSTLEMSTNYNTAFSAASAPPIYCQMTVDGHYVTQ